MNLLTATEWIDFFKWLVETDGGIATLSTLIIGLTATILLSIKQIRNAIIETIKAIKKALKGKNGG